MNLPNNLNCTQFQAHTLQRLERNWVNLQSAQAKHVLELALALDHQANDVYNRLQRLQEETERRLLRLADPDGVDDEAALHLGEAMDQFAAEAFRAETAAAEMKLGRKMLQMATLALIEQTQEARKAEKA